MQEAQVQSLGQEDPLEKEMVTHSSMLAWEPPWTEEPDKLVFLGTGSEISGFLHFWQSGWVILEGAVAAGLKRVPSCVVY